MDFTPSSYRRILQSALAAGYRVFGLHRWFASGAKPLPALVLRHDVDRRPENALGMARLEAELGVSSTYYFRIVPATFQPPLIAEVHRLGHEVGYHYEDWSLAGRDKDAAIALFKRNLARLREIVPVRSIAMHGSPFSSESNMTLWKHYDFRQDDVIDAIRSIDYSGFVYFTDSGRTFGASRANLRDYVGACETPPGVRSCADLCRYLAGRASERVHLNCHPERWNEMGVGWVRQLAWDASANAAKLVLGYLRGRSGQMGI